MAQEHLAIQISHLTKVNPPIKAVAAVKVVAETVVVAIVADPH